MRMLGHGAVVGMVLAGLLAVAPASADNNLNGLSFRAVGWVKGRAEIGEDQITCEIPTVSTSIVDGAFSMGLWNTFGIGTLYFPDPNHPFGNPCGGWIQLQNNLFDQGIQVTHVDLRYRIQGARRFRQFVPSFRKFPIACRELRREKIFLGTRINPANSNDDGPSGAPNVAFVEMLPMVTPQLFHCLRDQYAQLSTQIYVSLSLVIRARVYGVSDAGDNFVTNPILYNLTLRHTCGNGRIDDGESCDPSATADACGSAICDSGFCSLNPGRACTIDADCSGVCLPSNDPMECSCVF
jgi:hypothetical protein